MIESYKAEVKHLTIQNAILRRAIREQDDYVKTLEDKHKCRICSGSALAKRRGYKVAQEMGACWFEWTALNHNGNLSRYTDEKLEAIMKLSQTKWATGPMGWVDLSIAVGL